MKLECARATTAINAHQYRARNGAPFCALAIFYDKLFENLGDSFAIFSWRGYL